MIMANLQQGDGDFKLDNTDFTFSVVQNESTSRFLYAGL